MVKRRSRTASTKNLDWQQIIQDYQQGMSQIQLAKKYQLTQGTVGYQLKIRGVELRVSDSHKKSAVALLDWDSIIEQNNNGLSCSQLAKQLGVTTSTIVNNIKSRTKKDITKCPYRPKTRYSVDDTVFDVLTDDVAYWIGMLITDGTIYYPSTVGNNIPQLILELQEQDLSHIQKFKTFLRTDYPISSTTVNAKKYYKLRVRSHKLVNKLSEYGVTSKKTHTAKAHPILVHNKHFWRGVIDGDGSVCKKGETFYICSASEALKAQFREFFERRYGGSPWAWWDKKDGYAPLERLGVVIKQDGRNILSDIYDHATTYLDRKYQRVFPHRSLLE